MTRNSNQSGLKIAREKMNIKDYELAAKIKVNVSVLRGWEAGAGIIPLLKLQKLTKILNVSAEMLLFAEDRSPLDISRLTEEQQNTVIELYNKLKS